ncbi:hypothetical protein BDV25DRAFT_144533 [Aspergillus avenaceus]|uniref:Uncharacterized protein n=1 Tax=Aspergillus avenaceus TaxID=36643 RepID=A0A5N6THI3_ASPAV|nr:hypothetical protein BDV25DRAFT_144533 [Aspergillus avenaceus]
MPQLAWIGLGNMGRVHPPTQITRKQLTIHRAWPAKASQLKVLGNTFVIGMTRCTGSFEAVFPGPYVAYSARMRGGDYHRRREPLFGAGLVGKDARHALEMARSVGADMKGLVLADEYLATVQEVMGQRGDLAGIYGAVKMEGGLEFEN